MQWIKRSKKGGWGGIKGWGEDELLLSIVEESLTERVMMGKVKRRFTTGQLTEQKAGLRASSK